MNSTNRVWLASSLALLASPSCKDPNPSSKPSHEQQQALRATARWDLQQAQTELSELEAVIAAVPGAKQREGLEAQAKAMEQELEAVAKQIEEYQRKADTEAVAGALDSGLADLRARIATLRAQVASGNYE